MDFGSISVLRRGTMMQANYFGIYDQSKTISYANPSLVPAVRSSGQWQGYMDASKQNNKLLVIEFTAKWCGPCRLMEQHAKDYAAKYTDVQFIRIDVDELGSVARRFGVSTLPALALVKNGKEVDKVAGVRKEELLNKIEKYRM